MANNTTPPAVRYGASPQEWQHFVSLGLTRDLLPVVSNPIAKVSPDSKMKALGKTPSRYTNTGVAGIPSWTTKQSTLENIENWQREPDYGICLQTRHVRALDVDVEDKLTAIEVGQHIRDFLSILGIELPMRYREDSGKFLLAFTLEGGEEFWRKRILKTAHGNIEFLAWGQQFIAIGTHPKGARYQWCLGNENQLPTEFPELGGDAFEMLWISLEKKFGIEKTVEVSSTTKLRSKRAGSERQDPVAEFLVQHDWVRSEMRDGRMNVLCPFAGEHSSDSGDTETQYFPIGVGGFEQGHFKCLHAHCANRTDNDFLEAVGYNAAQFDEVSIVVEDGQKPDEEWPAFARDKAGRPFATIGNVVKAVACPSFMGVQIRFDEFRDEIMMAAHGTQGWRSFGDADYTRLRLQLERRGFMPVGRELIRDAVLQVADEARFDSAITWLEALEWDGTPRIDDFLPAYFGAEDNTYTRAVSRYMWTAMAGRVMSPGCQADMVPILVGDQGVGKTRSVAAMAPSMDFFMEVSLDVHDDQLARRMRGKLIGEMGELRGLGSRDIEAIKQFVTRTHEQWVPKYREFAINYPRRLVFIGTTNEEEFLADSTGHRRWLPVRVTQADPQAVDRDRDQLWAEARIRFAEGGVDWRGAQGLATDVHDDHRVVDGWEQAVTRWLECENLAGVRNGDEPFTVGEALAAIGIEPRHAKRADELRMGRVLRQLGCYRHQFREGEKRCKKWVRHGRR